MHDWKRRLSFALARYHNHEADRFLSGACLWGFAFSSPRAALPRSRSLLPTCISFFEHHEEEELEEEEKVFGLPAVDAEGLG